MLEFWNKIKLRQYEVKLSDKEIEELKAKDPRVSSRKKSARSNENSAEDMEKNLSTGRTDVDAEKEDQ